MRLYLALVVTLFFTSPLHASDSPSAALSVPATAVPASTPTASPQKRPKVALVLSGGGARGFAHIGVLKVLRELNVPVDMVIGTSMGAVVGGAYAAGYPVEKLEETVRRTRWNDVFTTKAPREDMDFRRREEDNRTISRFAFGLTLQGLTLPRGTFRSHVLDEVLRSIATPSLEVSNLDDLAVPFRSVATDLVSGELVVLADTTLFNAMRASMSIPGAFVPLELRGQLLADGGLARNLPVDVARQMGAEVIIAVNVGTPLMPRENLDSALNIAQQMINILTEQNVRQSLAELTPRDILISPDLRDVSFSDFDNGAAILTRGEVAARAMAARLRELSLPAQQAAVIEAARVARSGVSHSIVVNQILVQGTERSSPEVLKAMLDLPPGSVLTDAELGSRIRKLGARGDFERIDFKLQGRDLDRTLVVHPTEVEWGGGNLRFGLRLQSDFKSSSRFDLLAAHTTPWVNSYGGEWRNILQVGGTRRFETEFYQPVTRNQDWFVAAGHNYLGYDTDIYSDNRAVARFNLTERSLGVFVGRQIGLIGEVRVGQTRTRATAEPVIVGVPFGSTKAHYTADEINLRLDTHDSANFPRSGYSVYASWQRVRDNDGADAVGKRRVLAADFAVSKGQYTLYPALQFVDAGPGGAAGIGGFLNLSGTPVRSLLGTRALVSRTVVFREVGRLPGALGGTVFAGASFELGNTFAENESIRLNKLKRASALILGAETIIGPLYLGAGKTFGGSSAFYLFLGQP